MLDPITIQSALKAAGHYTGALDGLFGPRSRAAADAALTAAARLNKEVAIYDFVGGFTANTTNGSTAITSVAGLSYPTSPIGARGGWFALACERLIDWLFLNLAGEREHCRDSIEWDEA